MKLTFAILKILLIQIIIIIYSKINISYLLFKFSSPSIFKSKVSREKTLLAFKIAKKLSPFPITCLIQAIIFREIFKDAGTIKFGIIESSKTPHAWFEFYDGSTYWRGKERLKEFSSTLS